MCRRCRLPSGCRRGLHRYRRARRRVASRCSSRRRAGHLDAARLSRALAIVLGVAARWRRCSRWSSSSYIGDSLGAQESELARQISARRAAIRAGSDGGDRSPVAALERRKYETPSSVIVLEALSRVLPDHTYVTELHLAGNKLQIVGITRDAPSLIPLIEQSQHFTRATFYAPTTRSPSDPGERFHIEARVEPKNTARTHERHEREQRHHAHADAIAADRGRCSISPWSAACLRSRALRSPTSSTISARWRRRPTCSTSCRAARRAGGGGSCRRSIRARRSWKGRR